MIGLPFTLTREEALMPGAISRAVDLSTRQRALLEQWVRQQTAPQRLVRRASIVLGAAAGRSTQALAAQLQVTLYTVRTWRQRWQQAQPRLQAAEATASEHLLATLIEETLMDLPRPGGPPKFTPEQIIDMIAVSCEPPADSNRPISHWTARELAAEVARRGIVGAISPRQMGRFLK